jgi:mRNA-degrading endonuclease RelE of RelBE toxin-antitoxin system
MAFTIIFTESSMDELGRLRRFDRRMILDRIDEQLTHQPTQQTRNKKRLVGSVMPWESADVAWELRIGEFRVFYDVDESELRVTIRAVRHKPPHLTIGDIL